MDDDYMPPNIFDKESTISKNAGHIERILILQQREDAHHRVEMWLNTSPGTTSYQRMYNKAHNSLLILLSKLDYHMQKKYKKESEKIYDHIKNGDLLDALYELNAYLLKIGLTNFYKKYIDTTNVETENREKGL